MDAWQLFTATATVLLGINVVFASIMVFFERRNPASTWAWLLVLCFIPVLGFFVYLIFGRDGKREKVFLDKEKLDYAIYFKYIFKEEKYKNIIREQKIAIEEKNKFGDYKYLSDIAYLHIGSGCWITENNRIQKFLNGTDKFNSLINDIRNAKKYIHMEYYIIRGDNLGKTIVSELAKKAFDGVEVKLLYDGMGCNFLPKHFFDELIKAGGKVEPFLPPFIVRINYRNHRKICIIDSEIGYIGGFNIGDEYLGNVKRYGNWRDTHLRVEGNAVDELQLRFVMDWNFTSKEPMELLDRYFETKEPYSDEDGRNIMIQIVSSGPDTRWKNIRNGYFKMINEAEDHIYIETPYFVPDDSIFEALKVAALSGIDVRVIIPANPDHFFVYWASMSYLGELLEAGVKCYQYENGFIHAKAMFVDGMVASIGTANMDVRSFALNFEINAFIYDEAKAKDFEQDFLNDLDYCTEITMDWYYARSAIFKFKESVSRLISPML